MAGPKNIAQEAMEQKREASTPGARGHEYRDKERLGDEGQPYKRGGATKRERGGYMPEEVAKSEGKRGQRTGKALSHDDSTPAPDMGEAKEAYSPDNRKNGGKVKHQPKHHPRKSGGKVPGKATASRPDRRARGGATSELNPMTAAGNVSVPEYQTQHDLVNGGGKGKDKK